MICALFLLVLLSGCIGARVPCPEPPQVLLVRNGATVLSCPKGATIHHEGLDKDGGSANGSIGSTLPDRVVVECRCTAPAVP